MKRKNLFLSLISSVLVAVAIITVTVVSVVKPNNKNNSGNVPDVDNINIGTNVGDVDYTEFELENSLSRDGSEEFPYLIYSVESFNSLLSTYGSRNNRVVRKAVTQEVVDENGETTTEYKRDENGRIVFEDILNDKNEKTYGVYFFELACDIDFAGVEFKTLFNDGTSFIGGLDGKNFSLKSISIKVTEANLESDFTYTSNSSKISHIALFGNTKGAKISNIKIENINVELSESVYSFIVDGKYNPVGGAYGEVQVAGLIAYAKDTEISGLTMSGSVAGSTLKDERYESGNKAIAGVIAYADNSSIKNSNFNVNVKVNASTYSRVAGVIALVKNSVIENTTVEATVETTYSRNLTIAGLVAYAKGIEVSGVEVNFNLKETASQEERDAYVSSLSTNSSADMMTNAAGLIAEIRANDDTQKAVILNTRVVSNVDFDCVFAGLILDVYSKDKTNTSLVTINNISVDMNVNVLAFHALARQLEATNITLDENSLVDGYNIVVIGTAKLESYKSYEGNKRYGATIITAVEKKVNGDTRVSYKNEMFFIKVSKSAQEAISKGADTYLLDYANGTLTGTEGVIPGAYTIVD